MFLIDFLSEYYLLFIILFGLAVFFLQMGTPSYHRKKRYRELNHIFKEAGKELLSLEIVKKSECPYIRELSADGSVYVPYRIEYKTDGIKSSGWAILRMQSMFSSSAMTSRNTWIFRDL